MSILKKQKREDEILIFELKFMLIYHLNLDCTTVNSFLELLLHGRPESKGLKNYWLQKKECKEQAKEHNNKLDDIARFVTKYINNRKSSKG